MPLHLRRLAADACPCPIPDFFGYAMPNEPGGYEFDRCLCPWMRKSVDQLEHLSPHLSRHQRSRDARGYVAQYFEVVYRDLLPD